VIRSSQTSHFANVTSEWVAADSCVDERSPGWSAAARIETTIDSDTQLTRGLKALSSSSQVLGYASNMNDIKSHVERSQVGSRGYALSGLAISALGVWAVLGPFVGPGEMWTSNFNHVMLSVVPAAGAVLGGLMMLSQARQVAWIGGLVALAGGLWFMIGPMSSPLWPSGGIGTGPAPGGSVWLAQWGGFLFVTGAVITLLSSYALGFLASDDVFEQEADADRREPVTPEHARRRPLVRQPATRRERPHAPSSRERARHRS
jgi:hypothetical protein